MTYANLAAVTAFFDRYDETNAWARTNQYGDDSNPIVEVITGQDLIVGTQTQGNPPEWTFNYSGTSGTSAQTVPGDWQPYGGAPLNATVTSNLPASTATSLSYQWHFHYEDDYHWVAATTMNLHYLVDSTLTRTLDLSDEYTTLRFYNDARAALNNVPWGWSGGTATATLNSTEDNLTLGRLRYRLKFPTRSARPISSPGRPSAT